MVVSQSKCDAISVNENGDSSGLLINGAHKMGHDPLPIIDLNLNPDMINEYGQLIGEYSKLDDELCLPKCEDDDDDALEFCHDFNVTFHEKMVDLERPSALNLEPLSEHVDHSVSDGAMAPVNENTSSLPSALNLEQLSVHVDHSVSDGAVAPVNENTSSLEDSSENQSQIPSPVSVLKRKRSYSNATTSRSSQIEYCQPTKDSVSGGLQYPGTIISTREQNQAVQSEAEYSLESFLLDETEDSVPLQVVRTRKVSDLLDLNHSNRAVKKCMHCESTETPQWRNGPMGRKTLCNACGVQYKHGRLFDDYRPLRSPTFDPSKHFSVPKKFQELRMGHTSARGPNIAFKTKKVKGMNKGNNARDCDPDFTLKPKKFKEMRMGNRCGRVPNPTLKPKKVQELRMGSTCERDSNPTVKPKNALMRMSNSYDLGQNLAAEPRRVEEMRMGNKNNLGQNLTSKPERVEEMRGGKNNERDQNSAHNMGQNHTCEPERAEEMSWGDNCNNKMDQNRAHRAKKFQNLGEKDSDWLDSDSWERDRNFESGLQWNQKVVKTCTHCASTETPQWREGPSGRKTLCNACGVQYRHGRLFPEYRPLKSPTYDPLLHSHLPKKVMEMRMRLAEKCAASSNCEDLA